MQVKAQQPSPTPSPEREPQIVIIFGASRGIGACIARTLSLSHLHPLPWPHSAPPSPNRPQYHTILCSKTTRTSHPSLPGNIDDLRDSIISQGGLATSLKCNVRHLNEIKQVFESVLKEFKRIDAVIYNPGSIFWGPIWETVGKRFEVMYEVNLRGYFQVLQEALPIFLHQGKGRIIAVSPPIYSRFFRGKAAYASTKVGMSVLTMGVHMDLEDFKRKRKKEEESWDVAVCGLWPATGIQSYVTDVQKAPLHLLRKPDIFADAVLGILTDASSNVSGRLFIDEDYLREQRGMKEFERYQCAPGREPPRMMPKRFPDLRVEEQEDRGVFADENATGKTKTDAKL
ncbi:hypothetical protein HDV05_002034 [Chytridiales sp. JEL 0842]|nr:hypothetical protein HDV05_002034 [Chytridiales sp. JEL 0842]